LKTPFQFNKQAA